MKCYLCETGILKVKEVPYQVYGERVGTFPAEVCEKCGETFFDEETSHSITQKTKEKGLFGLGTRTKIGQAGSTLDVRLPKKIIDYIGLKQGTEVTIYPESKHKIIIEI